jgi:CRISPR-associated protein Cas2
MNIWIVYDIESSVSGQKRRRKIVKEIEEYGLYRVQKSVFFGNVEKNRYDELVLFSNELIDPEKDSVYLFPMCNEDFNNVKIIGLGFDRELVAGKKSSLMF